MRRALCLSLLLLGVVMVLVSGAVQAGQAVDTSARGGAWLSLRDAVALSAEYTGPEASTRALEQGLGQPLALAAADLDEDGVPDLVAGYAVPGDQRGVVALYRGNVGAIYPAASGSRSPFLEDVRLVGLAIPPDFLATGDFDGDGHLDLVAAAYGDGDLVLLPGDGRGGLGPARATPLPGRLTALVAGEIDRSDGLADLAVGVIGPQGPYVLVFEGPDGALRNAPAAIPLPTSAGATALALGHLDGDYLVDLAVAAGRELLIVQGRDRRLSMQPGRRSEEPPATVARHSFPLDIAALAAGDFVGDPRTELALLFADGSVQILDRPTGGVQIGQLPLPSDPQTTGRPALLAARVSSLPKDDLLVLDGAGRRLHVLMMGSDWVAEDVAAAYPGLWPRSPDLEPLALDLEGEPLAVLPMRLNEDALSDLVILRAGSAQPVVALTAPVATFTVDSTGDGGDSNAGDGVCNDGSLSCTLRAAIEETNALAGADLIRFNIPGTGTHTITLGDSLAVNGQATIDAMSQPGFAGTPLIELNAAAVTYDALVVSGGNSVVRGLAINRSGVDGIHVDTAGNNTIEGNYIGTDLTGLSGLGNGGVGIRIEGVPDNTIGGTAEQARNLISDNRVFGVHIVGITATRNRVMGNYIGTTADGSANLGNVEFGVLVEGAPDNTIGGAEAGAGNLVSGNGTHGVVLTQAGATGNLVQGNYIGTDKNGTADLGNAESGLLLFDAPDNTLKNNVILGNDLHGVVIYSATATANLVQGNYIGTNAAGANNLGNSGDGVLVDGASYNTIGGEGVGISNAIAHNGGAGVSIREPATCTHITRNSIHDNGGLGIDLGADGHTPNDSGDGDGGANKLQNWPEISEVAMRGELLAFDLRVDSTTTAADYPLKIDFFLADSTAPGAEGKTYLGMTYYLAAEAQTTVTRMFTPTQTPAVGDPIVATAADFGGNTSEFSTPTVRVGLPVISDLRAEPGDKVGVVDLWWSSPSGGVDKYEVRYYEKPITESNWDTVTRTLSVVPTQTQSITVSSVATGTRWHFAMKTGDNAGNWSSLSNVPSLIEIGLRPKPHGYSFPTFDPGWGTFPTGTHDFWQEELVRMFGQDAVCWMWGSVCIPLPDAARFAYNANLSMNRGHCHGMAVTSLRFFKRVGGEKPSDLQAGATHTGDLSLNSARRHVAYYHVKQYVAPITDLINAAYKQTLTQTLDLLGQAMLHPASDPLVLLIRRPLGAVGHSLSPYALQELGGGKWQVWVYDNLKPAATGFHVHIDTAERAWSYDYDHLNWTGKEISRTLGVVAVAQYTDPQNKHPCPWCPPTGTQGTLDESPSAQVWMVGGGHLLITDSQGRRIGYAGDLFVSEIPGAYEHTVLQGPGPVMEPLYTLPLTEAYTILIDGQTLTETDTLGVTQFGPGYAAWADDVTLEPASQDELVIAADGSQLAYKSNDGQEATLTLALDGAQESHQLQIQGADIGAGQLVSLTADAGIGHLAFNSAQASGGKYNLEVIRVSAAGEERFFHMGLLISASDTHYADYGAWDGSGSMTLYVDHGSDGSIDETWDVANHANRVYLPLLFRSD